MNIKTVVYTTLFISSVLSTHAFAARGKGSQAAIEGTTFTSAAVVGAVAAGPVGLFVGALGGSYLAKQTPHANDHALALESAHEEKRHLAAQKAVIANTLDSATQHMQKMEGQLAEQMAHQILFASGHDQLTEVDERRVIQLATFLKNRPHLDVLLSGHTDPRGTDEYNNVLSIERALSIENMLVTLGIEASRIKSVGHGASQSKAPKGDTVAYQHERRVDIQIVNERIANDSEIPGSYTDALGSL